MKTKRGKTSDNPSRNPLCIDLCNYVVRVETRSSTTLRCHYHLIPLPAGWVYPFQYKL